MSINDYVDMEALNELLQKWAASRGRNDNFVIRYETRIRQRQVSQNSI